MDAPRDLEATTRRSRRAPTVALALVALVAYCVVCNGLQVASGIDYMHWFATAGNALRSAVIPLAAGALVLLAFGAWSGWDQVWRDARRLSMPWYLWLPPAVFVLGFLVRFAGIAWRSVPVDLLLAVVASGVLVGLAEELLFRGFLLRALRERARAESTVMLVSSLAFGLFHCTNLLFGQSLAAVSMQVVAASISGVALYLFRRGTGWLVAGMAAHGLWDISTFLEANYDAGNGAAVISFGLYAVGAALSVVAAIVMLVRDRRPGARETASASDR